MIGRDHRKKDFADLDEEAYLIALERFYQRGKKEEMSFTDISPLGSSQSA